MEKNKSMFMIEKDKSDDAGKGEVNHCQCDALLKAGQAGSKLCKQRMWTKKEQTQFILRKKSEGREMSADVSWLYDVGMAVSHSDGFYFANETRSMSTN